MIAHVASAILGCAMFLLFALFGRWVVQDPRRAFTKFWPDDPHYPHKPWRFAVFKALGFFALFVGVMNATAALVVGLMPTSFRESAVVFIVIVIVSITFASLAVRRFSPKPA